MALHSQLCSTALNSAEAAGQSNRTLGLEGLAALQQQQQFHQATDGGRSSSTCTQVIWIFFWLFILIAFAYPIAISSALIYALLNPIKICSCTEPLMSSLMKGLNLPLTCLKNIVEAKQLFQT